MGDYMEELMEKLQYPEESRDVFRKTREMIEGTEEWNAEFETVKTIFRRCPSISIVPLLNRMERLAGRM